jgi:hypothetical protein
MWEMSFCVISTNFRLVRLPFTILLCILSSVVSGFGYWKTDFEILILKLKHFNFYVAARLLSVVRHTHGLARGQRGGTDVNTLLVSITAQWSQFLMSLSEREADQCNQPKCCIHTSC